MEDSQELNDGGNDSDNLSGDELGNDAEGVWSADIEQSFQEALAIYPPCGRRKIILSDEGKMYGRNELIARYIKLRTGKLRSRKQVSSHIQVMARRKAKEIQAQLKDQASKDRALQALSSMSSAQIVSATAALPPGHGASFGKGLSSVLPPILYPHMANLAPSYSPYVAACNGGPLQDKNTRDWVLHSMSAMSSAQIVSASAMHSKLVNDVSILPSQISGGKSVLGPHQQPWSINAGGNNAKSGHEVTSAFVTKTSDVKQSSVSNSDLNPAWQGRSIAGPRLRLVEFSAFLEQQLQPDTDSYNKHLFVHIGGNVGYADPMLEAVDIRQIADKFPDKRGGLKELYDKGPQSAFFLVKFWADINVNVQTETQNFYGVSSVFESAHDMVIQYSTKVCSFGKQVVEKIETDSGHLENGRYMYRVLRSPMCDYMINFILKLKQLPEKYMMNSVLENFTVLQVVVDRDTQQTLLCIAYVFEVSTSEHGAQHHVYRLVKD